MPPKPRQLRRLAYQQLEDGEVFFPLSKSRPEKGSLRTGVLKSTCGEACLGQADRQTEHERHLAIQHSITGNRGWHGPCRPPLLGIGVPRSIQPAVLRPLPTTGLARSQERRHTCPVFICLSLNLSALTLNTSARTPSVSIGEANRILSKVKE